MRRLPQISRSSTRSKPPMLPCSLQALLHRAATGRPLSLLKYAMTADGKIACSSGHSAWVSSPDSRKLVFEARARSDAIIVGGNTVRLYALHAICRLSLIPACHAFSRVGAGSPLHLSTHREDMYETMQRCASRHL